ncbi:T9SS C-terminal target domain-containing protein [Sinomicrobium pectinilyticum]|uniref:T9SS C-terminal target domain-containing protein n=1 Tax=Sinomicrobium pectinilyticum TaxID=1084421 RepID=A0A3N0E786_SINP1|nr:T9SS type A sorting domain-containing protein [Sinomicrobium pectinilyticum]RNL83711.1 T9SS C-terminal target domain-containing protein [Sinomicrobium pectinilyticum]
MKNHLLIGLALVLFSPTDAFAQSTNPQKCEEILKIVESYPDISKITQQQSEEIFEQVKSCALEGNADAACLMGIFYKDGIGCTLSFDEAREWFSYAHILGSEKAAYSLGYLYLKGMGSIEQDYGKAIEWFEKSNYGMAKHWLAKCYYYGLGIVENKEKAMEILRNNPIYNSRTLLTQWEEHERSNNNNSTQTAISNSTIPVNSQTLAHRLPKSTIHSDSLIGEWQGSLYEMDWAGEKLLKVRSAVLRLSNEADGIQPDHAVISIEHKETESSIIWHNNSFTLPNANISVEQDFTDHPTEKELEYEIVSISLEEKNKDGNDFLIARLETWISNWSEPGPPLVMVLHKNFTKESGSDLLEEDKVSFTVYPNPFASDILVTYEVEKPSPVEITLYDHYGRLKSVVTAEKEQQKGRHTLTIPGQSLIPGVYIIQVKIAGKKYSKQVLKK